MGEGLKGRAYLLRSLWNVGKYLDPLQDNNDDVVIITKNIKVDIGHHQKIVPSQSIDIYFRKRFR